jgi:hypothetical protein
MGNRILKESICTSENIDALSYFQEVFFYRMIVKCDDFGRVDARPRILASWLFPLRGLSDKDVNEALRALVCADLITLYEVDGRPYLQVVTWNRHQQVRNKRSKYPAPEEECWYPTETLTEKAYKIQMAEPHPEAGDGTQTEHPPDAAGWVQTEGPPEMAGGIQTEDPRNAAGMIQTEDLPEAAGGIQTEDSPEMAGGMPVMQTPGNIVGLQMPRAVPEPAESIRGRDRTDAGKTGNRSTGYQLISDDVNCSSNPIQYESNTNPNTNTNTKSASRVRGTFSPPTSGEVEAYCRERGSPIRAEAFVNYYESVGWKVGSHPMKDWKAALRTWEQREKQSGSSPAKVVLAQQYEQRDYRGAQETPEEMMARLTGMELPARGQAG